jgi:hypothetical protein
MGRTTSDAEKSKAESIAHSIAATEIVSNQIAVPRGLESTAKQVDERVDKGIENNLDAELISFNLDHDVGFMFSPRISSRQW